MSGGRSIPFSTPGRLAAKPATARLLAAAAPGPRPRERAHRRDASVHPRRDQPRARTHRPQHRPRALPATRPTASTPGHASRLRPPPCSPGGGLRRTRLWGRPLSRRLPGSHCLDSVRSPARRRVDSRATLTERLRSRWFLSGPQAGGCGRGQPIAQPCVSLPPLAARTLSRSRACRSSRTPASRRAAHDPSRSRRHPRPPERPRSARCS
jgi:hypothetical protein